MSTLAVIPEELSTLLFNTGSLPGTWVLPCQELPVFGSPAVDGPGLSVGAGGQTQVFLLVGRAHTD